MKGEDGKKKEKREREREREREGERERERERHGMSGGDLSNGYVTYV